MDMHKKHFSCLISRSYCCMHYDRLLAWYCIAVHCGAQNRCWSWNLYPLVPSRALPIHFSRHLCCIFWPQNTANVNARRKSWQETRRSDKTLEFARCSYNRGVTIKTKNETSSNGLDTLKRSYGRILKINKNWKLQSIL